MRIRQIFANPNAAIFRALICSVLFLIQPAVRLLLAQSTPNTVNLRIIVVDSPAKADRVTERLKSGEDFATLARELSIDPTASDGGSMGRIDPSTLRSELRDAVKGIPPGQITSVVRVPSGYAILKVVPPTEADASQSTSPARILPSAATGTIRYAPN